MKKIHVLKDSRGLGIQIVARKNKIIVTGISEHGAAYRFESVFFGFFNNHKHAAFQK